MVDVPRNGRVLYQQSVDGDLLIPTRQFRRWIERRREQWAAISMHLDSLGADVVQRASPAAGTTLEVPRQQCIYLPAGTLGEPPRVNPATSSNADLT